MSILNKEFFLKNIGWMALSLSFTLVACFGNQSGIIREENIGVRKNVSVSENDRNSLTSELQRFLEQYSHRINIIGTQPPNNLSNNKEEISSHCEQIDQSVISEENGNSIVNIYIGDSPDSKTRINIISCGLERLKNKIESGVNINDLMSEIARYASGTKIKEFYDENRENIQISLEEIDNPNSSTEWSVFVNKLDIMVENNTYAVKIDSKVERNVQAHLLAHALSIIAIETNAENVDLVEEGTGLNFSTVQNLYYRANNSILIAQINLNSEGKKVEKQIIEAFYFYSRFYAYSTNRALKREGMELDRDLNEEIVSDEVIMELRTRKNFGTDKTPYLENLITEDFAYFIDVLSNIAPLPTEDI